MLYNATILLSQSTKKNSFKAELDSTKATIERLNQKLNDQSYQFERLVGRENDRTEKLDMLFNMIGLSGSSIENLLNTAGIVLTIIFTIFGIGIGIYVNWKEKTMVNLLERSDENLRKTREFRDWVENNLSDLYHKIKEEELNDIVQKIERDANQIKNHFSRLITLDVQKKDFKRFTRLLANWDEEKDQGGNIGYLLIFLINTFPKEMAANSAFSVIVTNHWASIFRSVNIDKLEVFINEYVAAFMQNKFSEIEEHVASIIKDTAKYYNAPHIARDVFFEKYTDKPDRFKILRMLQTHKVASVLAGFDGYQILMRNEYPSPDNTPQENAMLEAEIRLE